MPRGDQIVYNSFRSIAAMELTSTDLSVLVYNYAVVLSGGYATMRLGIDDRWMLFGLLFVFALFWTAYFRLDMVARIRDADDEE